MSDLLSNARSKIIDLEMHEEYLQSEAYRTNKILDEHKLLIKNMQSQLKELEQGRKIQMQHIKVLLTSSISKTKYIEEPGEVFLPHSTCLNGYNQQLEESDSDENSNSIERES